MVFLKGVSPNGQWALYVVDDGTGDSGSIAGGWSLSLVSPFHRPSVPF
jgi:hypothetical protein